MSKTSSDNSNVFINCPFDEKYSHLFLAIIFAVCDCGFTARCSLESDSASRDRLSKIIDIINNCQYGIHDISRIEIDKASGLPRFNMPFELGLFLGSFKFLPIYSEEKICLIFEKNKYESKQYLSDLSGHDCRAHEDIPLNIIRNIRNWLYTESKDERIPSFQTIKKHYIEFEKEFSEICKTEHTNCIEMPFNELVRNIYQWLETYHPSI